MYKNSRYVYGCKGVFVKKRNLKDSFYREDQIIIIVITNKI